MRQTYLLLITVKDKINFFQHALLHPFILIDRQIPNNKERSKKCMGKMWKSTDGGMRARSPEIAKTLLLKRKKKKHFILLIP